MKNTKLKDNVSFHEPNDFVYKALAAGRICAWKWDLITNEINLVGHFGIFRLNKPTKLHWNKLATIIFPDDHDLILNRVNTAFISGLPFEIEFRMVDEAGERQWMTANGQIAVNNHTSKKNDWYIFQYLAAKKKSRATVPKTS